MTELPAGLAAGRRDRLRVLMAERSGGAALLVTSLPNVRYLSGFSGSNAVLVVAADPDDDLIATDGRYRDQVRQEVPDLPVLIDRDTLTAVVGQARPGRTAVEATLSVADFALVRDAVGTPDIVAGLVEQLRLVKDTDELATIARACAITVAAFEAISEEIRVGQAEVLVARRLEQLFGELGAEDRAFDSIVGSGPNSAIPHHGPGARTLAPGDLLVVDAGARIDGYHADMTRTFVVGAEPAPWQAEVHALVRAAQSAGAAACRPLAGLRDVDQAARALIGAGGYADAYNHGLGHGVGLQIHEAPMIGARATGSLAADMAITVEPGIYLPGRGGVRIEDTLVVTRTGPRILTEAPRDLVVVG